MTFLRLVDGDERKIPKSTRDVNGHFVDLSAAQWRLNSVSSNKALINWRMLDECDQDAVAALRIHIVRLIETASVAYTHTTFRYVGSYLRRLVRDNAPSRKVTLASLIWYLERLRRSGNDYQFHHIRLWYRASTDRLIDGFDDETVFALNDLRIPGNEKGFAVLSADPEEGPLNEFEEAALRRALIRDDGPIQERAALWLALAFGTNAANLSLLREDDFEAYRFADDTAPAFFLSMPRIKKRTAPRSDFKRIEPGNKSG